MKKNTYLISLIVVAIIFCIIGFLIGKGTNLGSDNNSSNNNEAKQNVEKKEQLKLINKVGRIGFLDMECTEKELNM